MADHNGPNMQAHVLENPGIFLWILLFLFYGGLPEESSAGWGPPLTVTGLPGAGIRMEGEGHFPSHFRISPNTCSPGRA